MGGFRRRTGWEATLAALGALLFALAVPSGALLAAAPNALTNPSVSPDNGTTATPFAFSVEYVGRWDASTVSALVGTKTVPLTLAKGTTTNGTFAGSSLLPAGTWSVTFTAVTVQGNAPTISGGQLTVVGPTPMPTSVATPTPSSTAPTPTATPKTPAPTPAPTTKSGSTGGRTSGGGTVATPVPTPAPTSGGSAEAPQSLLPEPAGVVPQQTPSGDEAAGLGGTGPDSAPALLPPVLLGGFALIAAVIAFWLIAARRRQRREAAAAAAAAEAEEATRAAPAAVPSKRRPAFWEVDARLEDAPIGTVEYLPRGEG